MAGSDEFPPGLRGWGGDGYWIVAGGRRIRLALAGDVHGERHLGEEVRWGGNPLREVAPVVAAADAAALNLETPAGTPGTPQATAYVFLAPPERLAALRSAGVDVVSLANDHALDHGAGALLDAVRRAREAGLAVVGAGAGAEAFRPADVDVRGQRVGFVALSRVVPPGRHSGSRPQRRRRGGARALGRRARPLPGRGPRPPRRCLARRRCRRRRRAPPARAAGHRPPSDLTGLLDVTIEPGAGSLDRPAVETTLRPARIGSDGHPRFLDGAEADADAVRRSIAGGPAGCRA